MHIEPDDLYRPSPQQARAVRTAFLLGWLGCGIAVAIVEWLR